MGRQSDPNVERTLGHVGPTMGGVVTLTKLYSPPLIVIRLLRNLRNIGMDMSWLIHITRCQLSCK